MGFYRQWMAPDTPLSDSIRDCNSLMCRSTSLEKKHLIEIYDSLYRLIGANFWEYTLIYNRVEFQCPYGRGSVSTRTELLGSHVDSLVIGKIPVQLTEQAMVWEVHDNRHSTSFPMCSGSFTLRYLSVFEENYLVISPRDVSTPEHCTRSRQMVRSLFAQAPRLSSSTSQNNVRGIDPRVQDMKYIGDVSFSLHIMPCFPDPFQLLDTFMADSEYALFALSLTVCEPRLDSQSNKISWPIIHWFCDLNLSNEISVEEAEALFGIKVSLCAYARQYRVPKKTFSTSVEINTMCGFDPALEGADICEYFDLPRMEIFENSVGASPDFEINQIALPAPVHDYMDSKDATSTSHQRAENEPPASHAQNMLIVVLIALHIVVLSLVIHLSIRIYIAPAATEIHPTVF
ncbi:hypothetical protein ARMGADRAFT_670763 [Armillaria gallica]|uniref:Uncharacterized protein n=1 Tax=Armillaria gallica TaxID=47427 RepID=A0A2H3CQ00_ARMGA|nr:hypothetical protein ARMGADRAFT_670763 [Armillaria gallica]